jgi:O-antigen ligase
LAAHIIVEVELFAFLRHGKIGQIIAASFEGDVFERNNRITLILGSIGPAVLGSVLSIIVWVIACWNLICLCIGRLTHALLPQERRFCWMMACYPAAFALTSVLAPGAFSAAWVSKLLPTAIFLAPPLLIKRYASGDARAYRRILAGGAAIGSFAGAAMAALTQMFGAFQPEGLAGNPFPFAVAVLTVGTISSIADEEDGTPGLLGISAFVFACAAVLLSEERGVMIAIPVAMMLIWRRHRLHLGSLLRQRALIVPLAVTTLTVILFAPELAQRVSLASSEVSKFAQDGDASTSVGKRLALWRTGLSLTAESPLIGHGVQNRKDTLEKARLSVGAAPFGVGHYHNFIVSALVDGGLVLALATLVTIFAPLICAFDSGGSQPDKARAFMAAALVAVYVISGMTGLAFGHDILDTLYVFMASAIVFSTRPSKQSGDALQGPSNPVQPESERNK